MTDRVALGRIGKAHGLQGAFRVWPYADDTERFLRLETVFLTKGSHSATAKVLSVRQNGSHVVIATDAAGNPEEVRRWLGGDLEVDASERVELEPGRYFHDQIIGLHVETVDGTKVGTIARIIDAPANDVYVCRNETGDHLIPAVDQFIKSIEVEQGRMVIDPIPGMLDEGNA